jgi:hypothetical protein
MAIAKIPQACPELAERVVVANLGLNLLKIEKNASLFVQNR